MPNVTSSISIERLVLGAMLLNESHFFDVEQILRPEMFSIGNHQKIYQVISDLGQSGKAIRLNLVAIRLDGLNDDAEPNTLLGAMIHAAESEDTLPTIEYAESIKRLWNVRKGIDISQKLIEALNKPNADPSRICDYAVEVFSDISRDDTIEFEHTIADSVRDVVKMIGSGSGSVIEPCLIGLQEMIGGFFPGDLILWGGGPGSYKTAIALQQGLYASVSTPGALFELEMSHQKLIMRKAAELTGVSVRTMLQGVNTEQLQKIADVGKTLGNAKLKLITPPKMTIRQLEARARSLHRAGELEFMIVDHIKLIERPTKYRMPDHERAYHNAFDLKALAKDLEIPVIALCQFTKSARQSDDPNPKMEDFFGGSLEEHADVMLANLNRNTWLQKNPPTTNSGKRYDEWTSGIQTSEHRIEVHKLKDRTGQGYGKRIFYLDEANTVFKDLGSENSSFDFGQHDQGNLIPGDGGIEQEEVPF